MKSLLNTIIEMVSKLFRDEIPDFQARQGIQAKRFEACYQHGENLFAQYDEGVAENLELQ